MELIYAIQNKMPYGKVKNSSGRSSRPIWPGVTAAAAGAAKNMPDDFRVSITDAPGKAAYPISSFTWLLVPAKFSDSAQTRRHQRLREVDAGGRPEPDRSTLLRETAQGSGCEGNESARQHSVKARIALMATTTTTVPSAGPVAGSRSFIS